MCVSTMTARDRQPAINKAGTKLRRRIHNPARWVSLNSRTLQKSKVESCEHQDDTDVHHQPFPKSVSEEHEIYSDYDGYHRHHVEHDSYMSAHFSPLVQLPQQSHASAGVRRPCGQSRYYRPSRTASALAPRMNSHTDPNSNKSNRAARRR